MFAVMQPSSFTAIALAMVVAGTCHSFMYGPQAAFVIEQFHPRLRYTGVSLAYTIAGVVGGALAPLLFTVLARKQIQPISVSIYVTATCALTLVGLALGRESLPAEDLKYLREYEEEHAHL